MNENDKAYKIQSRLNSGAYYYFFVGKNSVLLAEQSFNSEKIPINIARKDWINLVSLGFSQKEICYTDLIFHEGEIITVQEMMNTLKLR